MKTLNSIAILIISMIAPFAAFGQIFITEIADPNNNAGARYVELYNAGGTSVNLTGWVLGIEFNANNAGPTNNNNLSGSIAAGGFFIIADNAGTFSSTYGFAPDQDGSINSNGDDRYFLYDNTATLVDIYGVPGQDGTNLCQEFEDGRAERVASVTTGNTTWTASEWNIDSDDTSPACSQNSGSTANAPTDFDPGVWIGAPTSGPTLSASPIALSGFNTTTGTASASQSFDLSGSDLSPTSGNITVTAPANFEVSLNNAAFSGSVNIAYTGGDFTSTPVYVRIASSASAGSTSGNVVNSGGGASDANVAVSGFACPAPGGSFSVGDISIVGFNSDTPDQFAFACWTNVPNGAELTFTENAYDGNSLASNEGSITWQNNTGSVIAPGTVIVYTAGSGFDLGTTSASSGSLGLSTGQDNLFIYEGTATCPQFIYGFTNNTNWVTSGSPSNSTSYLPAELNVSNGNLNTSSTSDNWEFSNPRNDQASIGGYQPLVNDIGNWTGNNSSLTLSSTDFTIASANPSVELSISAGSGSEAATSSFTITATGSGAVTGDQIVNLNISGAGITAGDYTISSGGVITILNGTTTGSVTVTVVDDADVEGPETIVLSYTAGGLSSGIIPGTSTSVDFDIADNDGTTLYSQATGGTNSAIWDIIPNGTPQPVSNFGGFSEFMDVVIQSGHTIDLTTSGHDMKSLTVQNGGKIYANNASSPEYIDLYGNVINYGTIGNGNAIDHISFNIKGSNTITFSGPGSYSIGRLRNDVAPIGTVILDANLDMNWDGACIYNNETNSSFNLTINAGKTIELTDPAGDVSIDGTNGAASSERGGSYSIYGTLIVPGRLYAFSNNSSLGCSITTWPGGRIVANEISVNIDGTGFTGFVILPGAIVEVNEIIEVQAGTIDSNGGLTINSGATLLHGIGTTGGGGSVIDNVIVKRLGATGNQYNFWSTPVASGTASVPGFSTYVYDSNLGTMDYSDDEEDPGWVSYSGAMSAGVGYASKQAGLASFSGPVNNGNISTPIEFYPFTPGNTDPGTPFNYVGNPYPGALDAAAFISANTNIAGSIYFWDDDLSGGAGYSYTDYATWNGTGSIGTGSGTTPPNGFIASCQGFVVRALSGGNINFNNSMRAPGSNDVFFRQSAENGRIWLSLEGEDVYNEILIGMIPEATESEDRLYDAVKLRGNQNISLASVNENREYSIMAFPHPLDEKVVPLNVMVGETGAFTFNPFRMENLDGYDIYFEDTKTEGLVLLSEETGISVELSEGEYINRFYLHFVPHSTTIIDEPDEAMINVYSSFGETYLTMNGSTVNGQLEVLGSNGQLIESQANVTLSSAPFQLNTASLSTGVYLVRFTNEEAQLVTRFSKF